MIGHGGSPEDTLKGRQTTGDVGTEGLQDGMVFRLDPLISEEMGDPPMWSMDPVGMRDWFFEDE